MFMRWHNCAVSLKETLVPWSVKISFGILSRAKIFTSSVAIFGAISEYRGTVLLKVSLLATFPAVVMGSFCPEAFLQ